MGFSKPKKPKKTAEQLSVERRTRSLLDEEIAESEEKFKALARGTLGRQSLLSGAPRSTKEAAGGRKASAGGGAGSLLGTSSTKSTSGKRGSSKMNFNFMR